jgi:lipoteichoic acid synthase
MRLPRIAAWPKNKSPWIAAWLLIAPLGICLIAAKLTKINVAMAAVIFSSPLSVRVLRLAVMAAVAWIAQRVLFPRRPLAIVPILAAIFVASVFLLLRMKPGETVGSILWDWGYSLYKEPEIFVLVAWRELATISPIALAMGLALKLSPRGGYSALVRLFQGVVVVLCAIAGIDLVYEITIGQPANVAVLLFSIANPGSLAPLVVAEATPGRVAALALCVLFPIFWAWLFGGLAQPPDTQPAPRLDYGFAAALAGSAALFLPVVAVGHVALERYTEGSMIALFKTAIAAPYTEVSAEIEKEFDAQNRPRWYSAGMKARPTSATKKKNVVIVMMESIRAASTSIHHPELGTTPFLQRLSTESLMVEDMSAVVPRTASAWIAILAGQYPLTNEGSARWTVENNKIPRIRGLPAMLRDQGYATSYFTPTHLKLLNEGSVIDALGFETVVADEQLSKINSVRANYMGGGDEAMVEPILEWTKAQKEAGRPFMTAIMTNVGHTPYTTPPSWKKVPFPELKNPALEDYYNCLLYIDDTLSKLMAGYRQLGVLDDTIFIFLGDHGQFFGEHGVNQAFNALYQEGLQIPMLIHAPGWPGARGVIHGPRQQIDILPTVMDMLGYEIDGARLPGVSLLRPVDANRKLYFSASIEAAYLAMRQGATKYIYSYDRAPIMVFDLASDPLENKPLENLPAAEQDKVKRDMLEWKIGTEMSMYARPADNARPDGPWVRR